jgi:hypothetical protein
MTDLIRSACLTHYADVARSVGIELIQLLRSVGLPPTSLHDPDIRIAASGVRQLLEASADAVALVAERPAAATTWRDDQIKVVAAGVFAGADGEIVLCGDLGLFSSKLHGRFELLSLVWKRAGEIPTQIEGQLTDILAGPRRRQPTRPRDRR